MKSIPAARRYIKKYVQSHTIDEAYSNGEVAYDGAVELWFDSVADQEAFFSDAEYLKKVQPDESRFADMDRTAFFLTREEPIIDNTGR